LEPRSSFTFTQESNTTLAEASNQPYQFPDAGVPATGASHLHPEHECRQLQRGRAHVSVSLSASLLLQIGILAKKGMALSQHIITLPVAGRQSPVALIIGFDSILREIFGLAMDDYGTCFTSSPGSTLQELTLALKEKVAAEVPQSLIDGTQADADDFALGHTDTGRRLYQYDSAGNLTASKKW
jgi:hypothetical protein